jgi:tetratricopeptide (TPR) repeat protein
MNTNNQNKAGLVPSQTSALSPSGVTSLVRRGRQDLIAKAEAEQWCNQGRALWRRQQYGEAVECFRHGLQLDPNHVELQFLLGAAYHQGNGLPERDHTQAALWYRRAAEQGLPAAQALLGMMYEWSWGVLGFENDDKDQIHDETARQSRSALGIGLTIREISKFRFDSRRPRQNRGLRVFGR